ncbi:MAG: GTPase HflX [Leptolyngbya sp. PLA3]|nr:MAG: GTPase HflX [Cyanobacteria bacterium CYA]MCE7969114.1 GTPase HflX [Leptolyngbya sp. PL-A3]
MPAPRERADIKVQAERTVLAAVRLPGDRYDFANPFGELAELTRQAGGVVVGEVEQRRERPEAGTYMGLGKVDELRLLCDEVGATTIIFDHDLSPKQISKIEQLTGRKVLDRSELILDIFASRATTHEAKLQVELAQLEYTYPRLRAMWDHLERIVGGGGIGGVGTRGPGEQQLEIDRRLVQRRKLALQRELEEIQQRKRRAVQQRNVEHFTVGLVGYTNAGKSTLFNTLTTGGAYADDRLFATLMTRTREWDLGGGNAVMLSDTVGFVRDLPHNLVASFRATLEEATHADLLLIVLDVADPAAELHYQTVQSTLDSLFDDVRAREERLHRSAERDGASPVRWQAPQRVLLLNKVDRLADNRELLVWKSKVPDAIAICALPGKGEATGVGQEELRLRVLGALQGPPIEVEVRVPLRESKAIHAMENRGQVLGRDYETDAVRLRVRIGSRLLEQIRAGCRAMRVAGAADLEEQGWAK